MEMPGARRSNYTLLSQFPDDQVSVSVTGAPPPHYDSSFSSASNNNSGNNGKSKGGFDWDHHPSGGGGDHRPSNRAGNMYSSSLGLQRQSSGSSFGESSLSGDYYVPTLSAAGNEIEMVGFPQDDGGFRLGLGDSRMQMATDSAGGSSSGKSWAQQTEESYQLQLALALRLSSEATCADDPNFLDPVPDESALRTSPSSAETVSHRFWVLVLMPFVCSCLALFNVLESLFIECFEIFIDTRFSCFQVSVRYLSQPLIEIGEYWSFIIADVLILGVSSIGCFRSCLRYRG